MRLLSTVCGVFLLSILATAQAGPSPDAMARALQKRYEGIRDFSADFVQTYRGGVLRTETRERGTVSIKKPGLMRWVYLSPERKEFVSDGAQIYSYIPADRQVRVDPAPEGDDAGASVLFLAGKGDLVKDFIASAAESPVSGTVGLKLTPRKREPGYEYLIVAIDEATLQIRGLSTRDDQGGDSTIRFDKLKENTGISSQAFVFRIPRGVDVITNARSN